LTVPQVNASKGDGYSSIWIGIRGQIDKTLIQVVMEQDSSSDSGRYLAWCEMLPSNLITIDGLTISPGDTMVASLNLVYSDVNVWDIQN